METGTLGRQGVAIARLLWPDLMPVPEGSPMDKGGVDMLSLWTPNTVQVKTDRRISESGNLYWEVFEKSYPDQAWRPALARVEEYIFITVGFGLRCSVQLLAEAAQERRLCKITGTSMGFIIPLVSVPVDRRAHTGVLGR